MPIAPYIAVDVGNSRIKFGLFTGAGSDHELPEPVQSLELPVATFDTRELDVWLAETMSRVNAAPVWWIASVNRAPTEVLVTWLAHRGAKVLARRAFSASLRAESYCLLRHSDLPLAVSLPEPARVGIDRLLGAVAANRLRAENRPAIVIDVGSAITVDLVSDQGAFLGGAILPGIGMSARAMHDFTDLLPRLAMDELDDPPLALGTSTVEAMQSGLYWGAVGAMKELIARLSVLAAERSTNRESLHVAGSLRDPDASLRHGESTIGETRPRETLDIFLTGGAAPSVAQFVDPRARFVPHLVLGGIALVAQQ